MNEAIPLPNVNEPVLRKVVEWCEHHRKDPPQTTEDDNDSRKKSTEIDEWDQKFMQVDQEMLFEIILVCFPSLLHSPMGADMHAIRGFCKVRSC